MNPGRGDQPAPESTGNPLLPGRFPHKLGHVGTGYPRPWDRIPILSWGYRIGILSHGSSCGDCTMLLTIRSWSLTLACLLAVVAVAPAADAIPKMKFNEVKEVAPGVFFRYSSIGPEGSKIPFGGSNEIWVVMEDYVVVVDANFPTGAGETIEAIKK